MSITIDLPPAVVKEATAFAESRNTTLERMISDALGAELARRRNVSISPTSKRNAIPQDLIDITGVVSLPPDKSENDFVREAMLEKYGV
jgi:hypothetical protein